MICFCLILFICFICNFFVFFFNVLIFRINWECFFLSFLFWFCRDVIDFCSIVFWFFNLFNCCWIFWDEYWFDLMINLVFCSLFCKIFFLFDKVLIVCLRLWIWFLNVDIFVKFFEILFFNFFFNCFNWEILNFKFFFFFIYFFKWIINCFNRCF